MSSMIWSTSGKRPVAFFDEMTSPSTAHSKQPSTTGDEGEAGDVVLEGGEDLAGHPLGAGQVAALGAVFKGDGEALLVHGSVIVAGSAGPSEGQSSVSSSGGGR